MILTTILNQPTPPVPAGLFVAPGATGGGSFNDPASLSVMAARADLSGQTVWLRGGTYVGDFRIFSSGVTFRNYNRERATIDGRIQIRNVSDVTLWGLEIYSSFLLRQSAFTGQDPPDVLPRLTGLELAGARYRIINCIIHDTRHGMEAGSAGTDGEITGCIVYNTGWLTQDDLDGHPIYAQNNTGRRYINDCVFIAGFTPWSVHCFGSENSHLTGFRFKRCLVASGSWIMYGGAPVVDGEIRECMTWDIVSSLGNINGLLNADLAIVDNYFVSPNHHSIEAHNFTNLTYTGNMMWAGWDRAIHITEPTQGFDWSVYTFNNNEYRYTSDLTVPFEVRYKGEADNRYYNFAGWKTYTGQDASSVYYHATPTGTKTFVYANPYEADRGHVLIYNWEQAASVTVDLSALNLTVGKAYQLRQAYDYYGDVVPFTYSGAPVVVDMQAASHNIAVPVGWGVPLRTTPFPAFGAFVLEAATPIDPLIVAANNPNARYHRFPLTNIADTWDLKVDELL